jgi:hypothetical protein
MQLGHLKSVLIAGEICNTIYNMIRCNGIKSNGDQCSRLGTRNLCFQHELKDDCSICLQPLSRELTNLPCNHTFHTRCIQRWNRNCPICRAAANTPEYMVTLLIQKVSTGSVTNSTYRTNTLEQILQEFGINQQDVDRSLVTQISFGINVNENLQEVLRGYGIPSPDTISPT